MTITQKAIGIALLLVLGLAISCAPTATPTPTPVPKATTAPAATAAPATPAPKPAAAATTATAPAATPTTAAPPKAQGPIKIGVMLPLTGNIASIGEATKRGIDAYFSSINNEVAGRKIELINEDDASDPPTGVTKVRKLVERDNINVLTGIVHSGVSVAIRDYVHAQGLPEVIAVSGAPALTQDAKSPHIFRVTRAFGQGDAVGAWYAYEKLGYKKALMIYLDYEAGNAAAAGFKRVYEKLGGKIIGEIKPAFGSPDYAPYLTQVAAKAGDADFLWAYLVGGDAIQFVKGADGFGIKDKVKLFANGEMFAESILPPMGDSAIGYTHYTEGFVPTVKTPEVQQFVKTLTDKYGAKQFSALEFNGWIAAQAITEAAKKVNGNVEDRAAFEKALREVSFKDPNGMTFKFDENQNTNVTVFIAKVVKQGNIVAREVLDTIPDVDQFWTPDKLKTR